MNKDKVWELTRLSHLDVYGMGKDREKFLATLQRFVTMVEREVRGDAEPVAWMYDWVLDGEEVKDWMSLDQADTLKHTSRNVRPLYLHPTPAVVRQLVEAAKRAMNYAENVVMAEGVYFNHDDDLPFIESALAAAKETGI